MSTLQIVLLCVSLITVVFLMIKIKKSQFLIGDSIFWILFSVLILIMAVFPRLTSFFSNLLGFESPSNFIFVMFIFLLLVKLFTLNIRITRLDTKMRKLVGEIALKEEKEDENA